MGYVQRHDHACHHKYIGNACPAHFGTLPGIHPLLHTSIAFKQMQPNMLVNVMSLPALPVVVLGHSGKHYATPTCIVQRSIMHLHKLPLQPPINTTSQKINKLACENNIYHCQLNIEHCRPATEKITIVSVTTNMYFLPRVSCYKHTPGPCRGLESGDVP